jgi:hypothetical protein
METWMRENWTRLWKRCLTVVSPVARDRLNPVAGDRANSLVSMLVTRAHARMIPILCPFEVYGAISG